MPRASSSAEQLDRIVMALEARAAARQRQQRCAGQLREFGEESLLPGIVRTVAVRKLLRIDAARDHPYARRIEPRIVAEHVVAHGAATRRSRARRAS